VPEGTIEALFATLTAMANATPLPASTSTLAPESQAYTIQRGDTPFTLAQRYGVSVEALLAANNIPDPTRLQVGQSIVIPAGSPPPQTRTAAPTADEAPAAPAYAVDPGSVTPVIVPLPPGPTAINGIDYNAFLVLDDGVKQRIRQIYAYGRSRGNNPRAFSKLGDSTIEPPHFLTRFDSGDYNLGEYTYLQPVIDYFAGSFGRQSVAIRRGLHTWSVLDPMWAVGPCLGGENMLTCEFRLNRPSLLFIRLGANDVGIPATTEENFRRIVEFAIDHGVIPILGTKADRRASGQINNDIVRRVATDYQIPLLDYDLLAQTLPGQGLISDGVHLTTFFSHDYTSPTAFQRGHSVHNLAALMTLDLVWRTLLEVDS